MLVWILQQVEIPPQEAERFCNELKPKTIEEALNALVEALFNAIYGAAEGMPMAPAWVRCGDRFEDLTALFQPPPSLDSGALDALRNEIRQFIRQQPDVQFNPIWGKWVWPVCVPAVPVALTPTQPIESAVADEAEPIPGSEGRPEELQPPNKPSSVDAPTPAGLAGVINVGSVDPAIAHAIAHAIKRAKRPPYGDPVAALDAALDAALKPRSSPSAAPASTASAESPGTESEPVLPPTREAAVTSTSDAGGGPGDQSPAQWDEMAVTGSVPVTSEAAAPTFGVSMELPGALNPSARAEAEPKPAPPTESLHVESVPSSPKLSAQEPLLLLPDEPQFEEPRKWRPDEAPAWFENAKQIHSKKPGESKNAYAQRLYDYMKEDFKEDIPWSDWTTLRRRLNDPPPEDD
jgi:hypothetical protein